MTFEQDVAAALAEALVNTPGDSLMLPDVFAPRVAAAIEAACYPVVREASPRERQLAALAALRGGVSETPRPPQTESK